MTDLVESEETRQNNTYTELLDQQILEKPHTNFNSINHETNKKLDEINSITRESNNDFPEEDQEQVNQDQLGVTGSLISTSSNPSAYDEQQNCHIVELENQSIDLRTPSYWDNFKSKCCFCQSNNDIPEQVQEQVNYGQLGARPKSGSLISTPANPLAASDKHSSVLEKFDEFPVSTPIIETDAPFDAFGMPREAESYLVEQQKGFDGDEFNTRVDGNTSQTNKNDGKFDNSLFRLLYLEICIEQHLEISRVQTLEISRLCT